MNELIHLLKEKFPEYNFTYRVQESFQTGTLLVLYYGDFRVHIHEGLTKYYIKHNIGYIINSYDFLFDSVRGLDKDEYFSYSTQFELMPIFLSENIDFIRSMWNNYPTHLTMLEINKV